MTQEKEQKHLPWNEGLPTGPDVDMLMRAWPEPKVGDRFEYEAVEKLIGFGRETNRFRTVTNNWRRRWLERNCVIECDPSAAFYVASVDQVTAHSYGVLQSVGRKAKRHRRKLASFTPDSDAQRTLIEHQARLMVGIERESRKSRMNLIPETKAPTLPNIAPPKGLKRVRGQ